MDANLKAKLDGAIDARLEGLDGFVALYREQAKEVSEEEAFSNMTLVFAALLDQGTAVEFLAVAIKRLAAFDGYPTA